MKMIAAAAATLFFCATAHAQVGTSSAARAADDESVAVPGGDAKNDSDTDPNRRICRRQKVIGSRLQAKRICATSAQWAQMRSDQRAEVERIQKDRPITGR